MWNSKNSDPAGQPSTGLSRALRDPEAPVRYRLVDRWADGWAGRRDGRSDAVILAAQAADDAALCARVWLARNRHLFAERDHHEFLAAQAVAVPMVTQLLAVTGAAARAAQAAEDARTRRAVTAAEPSAAELARRGPGELSDADTTIADRRRRAHQQTLAAADAAAAAAEQQASALADQADQLRAGLQSLFQITRTRSDRLREHHQRRAATFLRAHRRTLARRRGAGDPQPEHEDAVIVPPAWTDQPCPWTQLPAVLPGA